MSKPRVFIGSSVAGSRTAEFIQLGLDLHAECTMEPRAPGGLTGAALEKLAHTARSVDFAVLVLAPGDLVHGSDARNSPRDAVLMAAGLFMGALGRERTCLVYCRDELDELPGSLAGVPPATYGRRADGNIQAALGPVCTQIKMALERLRNVRELGSAAPDDAAIQRLSSELMSLRTEFSAQTEHVRRMMEMLTSEREPNPQRREALRLRALEGAWHNPLAGSWAYARFLGGELRFAYCYGGNSELDAEHYNFHFVGNALCARFRWFEQNLEGYVYFEEVSTDRLSGGWWFSRDVPEHMVDQLPRVKEMTSIEWVRQQNVVTPDWAEAFFKKIEAVLKPRS